MTEDPALTHYNRALPLQKRLVFLTGSNTGAETVGSRQRAHKCGKLSTLKVGRGTYFILSQPEEPRGSLTSAGTGAVIVLDVVDTACGDCVGELALGESTVIDLFLGVFVILIRYFVK